MFLLNFLFDFNMQKRDGLFSNNYTNAPLETSKDWLKLDPRPPLHPEPGDPCPPNYPVETADWINLGDIESNALLIPHRTKPAESNVGIRIAPHPRSAIPVPLGPSGAELTLVVCFGRPTQANHPFASPFEDLAGAVKTTFVFPDQKSNTTALNGMDVGWFFPLGMIKKRSDKGPHQTDRYEFSVGVKVVMPDGTTLYYGQDPEIDIGD